MNESRFDVFAVGNAVVDVIADTDEDFLALHAIEKGSMRLVDAESARMLYRQIGPAVEISGGSAANTIAGIASLGGRTAFTGKLGRDQLGEIFLHDLRAQGIHTAVPRHPKQETGRCLVLVTPDAHRSMRTFLGAAEVLAPEDLDSSLMDKAKILLLEGYVWASEQGGDVLGAIIGIARNSGARVAVSLPNPEAIRADREELLARLGDSIDVLIGNEEEMLSLYGVDDFAAAVSAARGNRYVAALTRSELGSVLVHGDLLHEIPAQPVQALDSTGAGDLYASGLLYGLSRGWSLPRCGKLASLTAAHIIGQYGGRSRTPLAPFKERV